MLGSAAVPLFVLVACATPQGYGPENANTPPPPLLTTNDPPAFISYFTLTNPPVPPPVNLSNSSPQTDFIPQTALPQQSSLSPCPTNLLSGQTWLPWETWSQATGWGRPQRLRNVPSWTYELKGTNGALAVTAGNRTALWNGLNLELGFPPQLTNGHPHLHTLDLAKTFQPLTLQPMLLQQSNRVIVIDPGHGGLNLGAKSAVSARYEKEFALDWALRTERLLSKQGWTVHLTRTNDVDLSLAERVAFADRVRADLFISLHFNSTDQPQVQFEQGGLETYCLTPVGMPSTLTRRFNDELNQAYPNNIFDAENYHFAARLHRALVETTQRKDRGVRRARFMGVLRGQNRPAVLLEGGYLSNPTEAQLIATAQFRQKLAEAVAKALTE